MKRPSDIPGNVCMRRWANSGHLVGVDNYLLVKQQVAQLVILDIVTAAVSLKNKKQSALCTFYSFIAGKTIKMSLGGSWLLGFKMSLVKLHVIPYPRLFLYPVLYSTLLLYAISTLSCKKYP